ncbi:4Fe-4S binding protein [Peptoniphilus catoniae]|uniref:4Fe-4S binding protein n=1 Tax=Peptoniphilus catoniae TaxID=1660341 RepID=UPI0010FE8269|nr:4Fe-4S binding protein [Peptoniphilus catoniae]
MDEKKISFFKNRRLIQGFSTLVSNIHLPNFVKGTIYTGKLKKVCLPGLNCYSCPGATGACPIGAFQAVVGGKNFSFSYYISGILIFLSLLVARLICGFICPFGFFQDLVYKIPFKKYSTKKLKPLRYIKYLIMIFLVWGLVAITANKSGISIPYFCKYVCPQGILEGALPLSLANPSIKSALGKLFYFKFSILALTIFLSIIFYRPFCKWICPLGAFYSLFNKISLYQIHFDKEKCIACGKCLRACKMDVNVIKDQAHPECIRCNDCVRACPTGALFTSVDKLKNKSERKIINENEKTSSPCASCKSKSTCSM